MSIFHGKNRWQRSNRRENADTQKRTEVLDDFGRLLGGAIELPHQVGRQQRGSVQTRSGNVLAVAHHLGGDEGEGERKKGEGGKATGESRKNTEIVGARWERKCGANRCETKREKCTNTVAEQGETKSKS